MATTTIPAPELLAELSRPRRVRLAQLVGDALGSARGLAVLYAVAAGAAPGPLAATLHELAAAKSRHAEALEPLVRALGADPAATATPLPAAGAPEARLCFERAFRGERALAASYRELLGYPGASALLRDLPRLAAEAALHLVRLRELYLRYS